MAQFIFEECGKSPCFPQYLNNQPWEFFLLMQIDWLDTNLSIGLVF